MFRTRTWLVTRVHPVYAIRYTEIVTLHGPRFLQRFWLYLTDSDAHLVEEV